MKRAKGARSLTTPQEQKEKKELIERLLVDLAKTTLVVGLPIHARLSVRRYIQKVLWSLSVGELKIWHRADTTQLVSAILDETKSLRKGRAERTPGKVAVS